MSALHWLFDRVWATLEGSSVTVSAPKPAFANSPTKEVATLVYARLVDEMADEAERRRSVESKLVAIGSVAPMAVTAMAALVTFLTSGRVGSFTRESIIGLSTAALYVSVQFLHATVSAIRGLRRMPYSGATIDDLLNDSVADETSYIQARAIDLAERIEQHRRATNDRVSQLALAHDSIINALVALIVATFALLAITVFGRQP